MVEACPQPVLGRPRGARSAAEACPRDASLPIGAISAQPRRDLDPGLEDRVALPLKMSGIGWQEGGPGVAVSWPFPGLEWLFLRSPISRREDPETIGSFLIGPNATRAHEAIMRNPKCSRELGVHHRSVCCISTDKIRGIYKHLAPQLRFHAAALQFVQFYSTSLGQARINVVDPRPLLVHR